ncbi:MAG TPA: 6-phosphogluconolactonase [Rhizomicrobium sp.]|nr:6-phosphogluconolactonase [Rhizomicrobium sp.]
MNRAFQVFPDAHALATHVARWLTGLAIAKDGPFAVALSGGTTPRVLYQTLSRPPFLNEFPWPRAHWFWGDERFVPHSDPESNFGMASQAMLSRAPVPLPQIHAIPTAGVTPIEAAARYARELMTFYGSQSLLPSRPLFDLVLLGLGEDGHTASLFPGSPVLNERAHWTAVADKEGQARITLTYPALESCANAAILVSGVSKRAILQRMRAGDLDLPAARYRPQGNLHVFTDREAAGCAA